MTKWQWLLVGLVIFCLALSGASWGQTGPQQGKGSGPGGLYNPQTVVTLAGVVVSTTLPSSKGGLPYLVYLILQTKEGKIPVFLGPSLYVDKLPVHIKVMDRIQVTGSKVMWEGSPVILAAEIKKGKEVLKLRDHNGIPVWSGQYK